MTSLKNKILVLGHRGMLGHMVRKFLDQNGFDVVVTDHKFFTQDFKRIINNFDGDYIVNCIGAIPQKTKIFDININLPIFLDLNTKKRIIHPGTDCEIDNDEYGISKKKASDYIKNVSNNTKILKASIIGPEFNSKSSLLEWFLGSTEEVNGYTDAYWNGVTTLEWSKNLLKLIENWDDYNVETILQSNCVSKYELLLTFKKVFNKQINIVPISGKGSNKCLDGEIDTGNIDDQLYELKHWYYGNRFKS